MKFRANSRREFASQMNELLYKEDAFKLMGLCMQVHRELRKGHDKIIFKDAFVVELSRPGIPFLREKNYEITYKGFILPHCYKPFQFMIIRGIRVLPSNSCNSCL